MRKFAPSTRDSVLSEHVLQGDSRSCTAVSAGRNNEAEPVRARDAFPDLRMVP
jgi:hypothetical protein